MSYARARGRVGVLAAVLVVLLGVPPVAADPTDDAFDALFGATQATAEAARAGIDVVQVVRFSQETDLRGFTPQVNASVPAGTRLRTHATVGVDGSAYLSMRRQPSGRLLAAGGIDPRALAPWATVLLLRTEARVEARRAGITDRTALTGIPPVSVLDPYVVEEPLVLATKLILPPYARSLDEGWSTIETLPLADGTTIIRGSIRAGVPASDGEDRCVRPLVEVTVGSDGVIRESRWTESCPGEGSRTYRSVATYGPQDVQGPTRPRADAAVVIGGGE